MHAGKLYHPSCSSSPPHQLHRRSPPSSSTPARPSPQPPLPHVARATMALRRTLVPPAAVSRSLEPPLSTCRSTPASQRPPACLRPTSPPRLRLPPPRTSEKHLMILLQPCIALPPAPSCLCSLLHSSPCCPETPPQPPCSTDTLLPPPPGPPPLYLIKTRTVHPLCPRPWTPSTPTNTFCTTPQDVPQICQV